MDILSVPPFLPFPISSVPGFTKNLNLIVTVLLQYTPGKSFKIISILVAVLQCHMTNVLLECIC